VPGELRGVIAACQAKDPAARPTLAQLQQHFSDVASPTTTHWLPAEVSAMVAERVAWASGTPTTPPSRPPIAAVQVAPPNPAVAPGLMPPPPIYSPSYGPPTYQSPPPVPSTSSRGPLLAGIIGAAAVVVIALVGLGVFLANRGGSPTPTPPPSQSQAQAAAINGLWKGSYVCAQGATSLQLTITTAGSGDGVQATFNFYSTADNTVPTGSFAMQGTFSGGVLTLDGDHWIVQPPSYQMVGLTANVQGTSPATITGQVTNGVGCTTFAIQRDGS
jgi:hypothetical protein